MQNTTHKFFSANADKGGGKSYIRIAQIHFGHSQMFLYLQQKFNND